jgi:hypothetical protein
MAGENLFRVAQKIPVCRLSWFQAWKNFKNGDRRWETKASGNGGVQLKKRV